MNDNMNSPALPIDLGASYAPGLTKREYAAIHLGVPDSGDPDLDRMIRRAIRARSGAFVEQETLRRMSNRSFADAAAALNGVKDAPK